MLQAGIRYPLDVTRVPTVAIKPLCLTDVFAQVQI
jgi:hypothetical protein